MKPDKVTFIRKAQNVAGQLAALSNQLEDIAEVYNSRGYGPGGLDAITDVELGELDQFIAKPANADALYAFIILADQFKTFMTNGQPAQSDYAATCNKIRTDI